MNKLIVVSNARQVSEKPAPALWYRADCKTSQIRDDTLVSASLKSTLKKNAQSFLSAIDMTIIIILLFIHTPTLRSLYCTLHMLTS